MTNYIGHGTRLKNHINILYREPRTGDQLMTFYIKELPDNTVTLLTGSGQIIGKFDNVDEVANITLETPDESSIGKYEYLESA